MSNWQWTMLSAQFRADPNLRGIDFDGGNQKFILDPLTLKVK